jgi:hypothetical protein
MQNVAEECGVGCTTFGDRKRKKIDIEKWSLARAWGRPELKKEIKMMKMWI